MNNSADINLFDQYEQGVKKDEKFFENYFDYINNLSDSSTYVSDNEITFPIFIMSLRNNDNILEISIDEMYYDIDNDSEIIFESDDDAYFQLYDELI